MSLLVYYSLLLIHINYLLATSITNIFGIIEGFLLNSYIVFGHKPKFSGLMKYSTVYAVSFVLNFGIMYVFVDLIHMSPFWAPYPTIAIQTLLNYFLIKRFVFIKN